jgi:hypothetical protein
MKTISQSNRTRFQEVISCYLAQQGGRKRQTFNRFHDVLGNFLAHKKDRSERNKNTSFLFNPFKRIAIQETTHSQLIGDLLSSHGTHGQDDLFLQEFLKRIGVANPHVGVWKVRTEAQNIDICLTRVSPASVVIIENKSNWAVDQYSQLYRYWHEAIHRSFPDLDYDAEDTRNHFKVIYLTPNKGKTPEQQSLTIPDHLSKNDGLPETLPLQPILFTLDEDLPSWLQECAGKLPNENHRMRVYLELYQEIWKSHP